MAAIPVSLVIGSPVAGWIPSHNWFAIEGWRWLFLLEGVPAVLLGVVAFFFLTDQPGQARWLTAEQRQWISPKLEQEKPLSRQSITIGQAFRSRTVLLLATAAFVQYFIGYSVIFWLPTILKNQSGFSDLQVGLFGAMPYVVALFAMLFNGWHSDKAGERRWHAAGPTFDRRNRITVPHQFAQLECNDDFTVEHDLHGHGISAGVLGDSDGNPQGLQRGSCSGNNQCARQPGRFCRTVRVWISPR